MSDDAPETAAGNDDDERRPRVPEDEVSDREHPSETESEDGEDGARRPPHRSGRRRGRPSRSRGRPLSSDEAAFRWTVRGVPVHVRAIALKAAEERGMTVGDWLAEAIIAFSRSGAGQGGVGAGGGPAAGRSNLPATESPPDLAEMVRSIDRRLTALEERRSTGLFGRFFGRRSRRTAE